MSKPLRFEKQYHDSTAAQCGFLLTFLFISLYLLIILFPEQVFGNNIFSGFVASVMFAGSIFSWTIWHDGSKVIYVQVRS
jgi:hypothetical protein